MKKMGLSQMENLEGGKSCTKTLSGGAHSEFSSTDACIICAGLGGATAGGIFGGPAGLMAGWASGLIGGIFSC